jgi:hypothetical protein
MDTILDRNLKLSSLGCGRVLILARRPRVARFAHSGRDARPGQNEAHQSQPTDEEDGKYYHFPAHTHSLDSDFCFLPSP